MGEGEKTFGERDTLRGVTGGAAWQAAEGLTFGDLETLREEGVLLAGRYKVLKRLGEGGMGSVWLAEDAKLDGRKVAVKMLPAILAGKKGAYKQVKAEAMVAMKLSHPNIATVRAFEEDEGGNPFLVMDYIDGEGLDDILAEKGALGEEETLRILGPVAAALDYAHSQGVVHRDVKPGNVMVRKDGTPFVLDFGIAREIQETMTRVTGKLSSGTLLYMSPEQLRGKGPKAVQDVYSFAAMAYECLAGRPPFARGQIEWQIVNEAPEELPESVGKGLRKGVMAGLAKEAEGRPGSCAAVLAGGRENDLATWDGRLVREGRDDRRDGGAGNNENRRADDEKRRKEEEEKRAEEGRREREEEMARAREKAQTEFETWQREKMLQAERRARAEAEAARGRAVGWSVFLVIAMVVAGIAAFVWWQGQVNSLRAQGTNPQTATAAHGEWNGAFRGDAREVPLPNGTKMRLKWCPEGTFTMGSPSTEDGRDNDEVQHQVTLTRGFWMAETEVTQGQWKALMGGETVKDLARKALQDDTGYDLNDGKGAITMRERWGLERDSDPMKRCGDLNDNVPVYNVSWGEAKEFCKRLTEKGHNEKWLPAEYHFRLPTEAEWEYACRAGTTTALPNGKDIRILGENNAPALDDIAWYGGNSSVGFKEEGLDEGWNTEKWTEKQYPGGRACARKVKGKAPNGWGLHDMIGNVWEWCEDEFADYPASAVEDYCKSNSSPALGVHRVMRGGSWYSFARRCRSACRSWGPAGYRSDGVGFRPVCSAGAVQ